jgi:hypothetical protein
MVRGDEGCETRRVKTGSGNFLELITEPTTWMKYQIGVNIAKDSNALE